MTFGERLKEIRTRRGISQAELGNAISASKATISRYENNTRNPKIETVKMIANVLDVHPSILIGIHASDLIDKGSFIESINDGLVRMEDIAAEMNVPCDIVWDAINNPEKVSAEIVRKVEAVGKLLMVDFGPPEEKYRKEAILDISYILSGLNAQGIETAVERIKELAEIPKYQRTESD